MVYFVTHEEPAGAYICASFPDSAGARAYIAANATPGSSLSDPLTIRAASALLAVQWGRVDPLDGIDRTGDVYREALAAFRALDVDGAPPLPSAIRLRLDLASALELHASAEISVNEWKAEARIADNARGAAVRETESIRRVKCGLESELAEAREALAEWKAKADKAAADCLTYRQQRDAEGARAHAAETALEGSRAYAEKGHGALDRLMRELSGLTLGMLPPGAYGAALVDVYCDIKAGR